MEDFNVNGDVNDVFNLTPDSFVSPEKKSKGFELYQPKSEDGREGVYSALVRFLPWWKKPSESKIGKYYVWVTDQGTGESFSVDCPSTVGQKSILKDVFWKLKNSPNAMEQELSKNFARAENLYSLVQIVKDPNKPELEGKILVYKFGKKINEKIESQIKPKALGATQCNPYDLFEGKLFSIHVTKKASWNNFDQCEFVGDKCALTLPGAEAPIKKVKEDMDKVLKWLQESSPDLDKYRFKEWTDEIREKVHRAIKNAVPDARIVDQLMNGSGSTFTPPASSASAKTSMEAVGSIPKRTAAKETAEEKKAEKAPVKNLDDLYAGL